MNIAYIVNSLRLRRTGKIWIGNCPSCSYRNSFTVQEKYGKILFHCHVGCDQDAVLNVLRHAGIWNREATEPRLSPAKAAKVANPECDDRLFKFITQLAQSSLSAENSPVEVYLNSRGLNGLIPADLRYLPGSVHKPTGTRWPVMLAQVRDLQGKVVAMHRTYLQNDGCGKATVEPAKMSLGPISGNSVHLKPAAHRLAVAEGIETALSIQQAENIPAWAALSAGGIGALILPPLPLASEVIIAADPDPVGLGAAYKAAERWDTEGRRIRIARPPTEMDFNDLLLRAES